MTIPRRNCRNPCLDHRASPGASVNAVIAGLSDEAFRSFRRWSEVGERARTKPVSLNKFEKKLQQIYRKRRESVLFTLTK